MATHTIRNPGPVQIPSNIKILLAVFAVIGVCAFGGALAQDARRAWYSFVMNHFFFLSLALGGAFIASLQWISGAMWTTPVRRVSESLTAYLPVAIVMFVVLYFGAHHLYLWTHPEHVQGDVILEHKSGYLSLGFWLVRNLIALGLLLFFTKKMVGNSIAQDGGNGMMWTGKNRALAPGFLMIFALGFTMAAFDQLMSLDPHWFSTMFGVYCFAGLFYSSLALTTILVVLLKRNGALEGIVNDNHLHDLGKFMFAFTVFWAYIGFSQFMLIWYANLPEETGYFLHRMQGSWLYVSIFLLVGKFLVPFFLLMPRDAKRNESLLIVVGCWMLLAQWVDMLWITQPEMVAPNYEAGPRVGWQEIGVTLGFVGVFGLMVARFLGKHNVVAIGDPRLQESVFHHHQ